MKFSNLFMILILLGGAHVFAGGRECDWARQVNKDEGWRVGRRNEEIARRNQIIGEINRDLEKHGPVADVWNHVMNVHEEKVNSLKKARLMIEAVIKYIQGSVITDQALRKHLASLQDGIRQSASLRLGERLKELAQSQSISPDVSLKLTQLGIAIETLEKDTVEWKKTEAEILSGQTSASGDLIDDMYVKLVQLQQQLAHDQETIEAGRTRDEEQTNAANQVVSGLRDRLNLLNGEIAQLQADNAKSLGYMAEWDVHKHCPRPPARDPVRQSFRN